MTTPPVTEEKLRVVANDQTLWGLLHGHHKPEAERATELLALVKAQTKGINGMDDVQLVVRVRPPLSQRLAESRGRRAVAREQTLAAMERLRSLGRRR